MDSITCRPYLIDDGGYFEVEFKINQSITNIIYPHYLITNKNHQIWVQKAALLLQNKK